MRILMTTKQGAGHFGPLIPFARAFRRAGADVLVAAPRSARAMVHAAGLPVELFDDAPDESRDPIFAAARQQPDTHAAAPYVFSEAFLRIDARAALPGVLEICRAWRPDVVVSEISEFAGPLAAEALDIPTISVGIAQQGKSEAILTAREVVEAVDELRAEIGLPADPDGDRVLDAPYLTLLPEALEDPAVPASRRAWRFRDNEPATGSADGSRQPWAEGEEPLVYVTFGSVAPTMDFFPGIYRAAIDALAGLPLRVLVTVGRDRDPAELGALPAGVHAERWVAQRAIMPHAAAMVCHGGSGTVTMGMAAGVPMAVVALFADQPWNARRVAAVGAGIALDGGADAIAGLREAVLRLIDDPAYRASAARIARHTRSLPAVDLAPQIVRGVLAAVREPRLAA